MSIFAENIHYFQYLNFCHVESRIPSSSRGRLTDRLIAQGLLTPSMLSELRKEWDAQQQSLAQSAVDSAFDIDEEKNNSEFKKMRRKRRK